MLMYISQNPESHGTSKQFILKNGNRFLFVHCDMNLECGGEKGWMRVVKFNADGEDNCPSGWRKITTPTRACRPPNDNAGCFSAHFYTHNIPYSRVCGMVIGYQKGSPNAFYPGMGDVSINHHYLDGISITYGTANARKHLWSYAAGLSERFIYPHLNCPCSAGRGVLPPPFVRDHYYCESGTTARRSTTCTLLY